MTVVNLFYGCDSSQPLGSSLFVFSVRRRASKPVALYPLQGNVLRDIYRQSLRREGASTDFAFTRFLAPYLCGFKGWSIFCDGADMLCTGDIVKLWRLRDPGYAVQVVQQPHEPTNDTKFLGQKQEKHAMKNWSSMMLFNNERCRVLQPAYVEQASGKELHQFEWLGGDRERLLGDLPAKWNQLIDVHQKPLEPGILHWTNGSPYFDEYRDTQCANLWMEELRAMMGQCATLVGHHNE